jgi:hypothetical protein
LLRKIGVQAINQAASQIIKQQNATGTTIAQHQFRIRLGPEYLNTEVQALSAGILIVKRVHQEARRLPQTTPMGTRKTRERSPCAVLQ